MTYEEAADFLGVKRRMIQRLVSEKKLHPTPISTNVRRIHIDDLIAFIDQQRAAGRLER